MTCCKSGSIYLSTDGAILVSDIENPFLIQVSAQQEPLFTDLSSDGIKTDASERFIYGPLSDD